MTEFHDEAAFTDGQFDGETNFGYAEFSEEAEFNGAVFADRTTFYEATFSGKANFFETLFEGETHFDRSAFEDEAQFMGVEFEETAYINVEAFADDADFTNAEFSEEVSFSGTKFGGDAQFCDAEFAGGAAFNRTEFTEAADFRWSTFAKGAEFGDTDLDGSLFAEADLTDTDFSGATLRNADFESALLSRATLFGANLRGAKLSGAVLGDIRINEETEFLGHASADGNTSPHTFAAIRSRPCCVYDPNYQDGNEHTNVDKAKSVYRALEELAGKASRPRLQSRCFVRRQDLHKDEYRQTMADSDAWEERVVAAARWSRAKAARTALLYGESPWRVVGVSLGTILVFSLLYPVWGLQPVSNVPPITYSRIYENGGLLWDSIYYSTLTFTTGPPDYQALGMGRMLTVFNTAIGPILIALLIFVFGRRAAR